MPSDQTSLPDIPCACANLRRAARLVTQLYSHEMGMEIEPAQFHLLSVLSKEPGVSQTPLSHALGLDKTTMSRNLALMQRNGWIEPVVSQDRRERGFRLTVIGQELFAATKPKWARSQAKLRSALKPAEWEMMQALLSRVAEAAIGN